MLRAAVKTGKGNAGACIEATGTSDPFQWLAHDHLVKHVFALPVILVTVHPHLLSNKQKRESCHAILVLAWHQLEEVIFQIFLFPMHT